MLSGNIGAKHLNVSTELWLDHTHIIYNNHLHVLVI